LEKSGDLANAQIAFEEAVRLNPADNAAHSALQHLDKEPQPANLQRVANSAEPPESLPDTPQRHNQAGQILNAEGDTLGSIGEFLRALTLQPDDFEARYNLAVAYLQNGDLSNSGLEFHKLLMMRPHDPAAHFGLGLVLKQAGDRGGAAGEFQATIAAKPDYPSARYYLEITQGQARQ